jgi:hypothetical protein
MKTTILPITMILLGGAIGFLSAPNGPIHAEEESTRLSPRKARDRSRSSSHAVPPDIAEKLRPIHTAKNPAERLRAVIHLANTLPIGELTKWYDAKWLTLQDGGDLNVFYEITRNRWIAEDPGGILDRARLKNWTSLGEITTRIAQTHPDFALEYLAAVKNPSDRTNLLANMARGLAENRPEALLHLATTQFDSTQGTYTWTSAFLAIAKSQPGLLENPALPPALRNLARTSLASTRLEANFGAELSSLLKSPTGLMDLTSILEDYNFSRKHASSLLDHINQLPPDWLNHLAQKSYYLVQKNPASWINTDLEALGMHETAAKDLKQRAWQQLASDEPSEFFALHNKLNHDTIESQANNISNALRALTWKNAEEAQEWLDYYLARTDDEDARKILQDSVSQADTSEKLDPESLRERLKDANNDAGQLSNLPYDLSNAGPLVMQEFRSSLTNMTTEEQAKFGRNYAEHDLSRFPIDIQANLIEAMIQHLPDEPTENLERRIWFQASQLATSWGTEDPVAASRWVTQLPAGEPRQWALRNLATSWMPYEPTAAEAWLKKLPAADQTDVRQFLESNGNGNR